jgi:hypothetical protein
MGMRIGRFVPYNDVSISDVFFPFWLFIDIISENSFPAQLWTIVGAALAAVGLNVPAMLRGVQEILQGPHRSASRPHITPGIVAETSAGTP